MKLPRCLNRLESLILSNTHQQPAIDLGTAREVVRLHLKEFERKGWLTLFRDGTEIADFKAIEVLGTMSYELSARDRKRSFELREVSDE